MLWHEKYDSRVGAFEGNILHVTAAKRRGGKHEEGLFCSGGREKQSSAKRRAPNYSPRLRTPRSIQIPDADQSSTHPRLVNFIRSPYFTNWIIEKTAVRRDVEDLSSLLKCYRSSQRSASIKRTIAEEADHFQIIQTIESSCVNCDKEILKARVKWIQGARYNFEKLC